MLLSAARVIFAGSNHEARVAGPENVRLPTRKWRTSDNVWAIETKLSYSLIWTAAKQQIRRTVEKNFKNNNNSC